VVLNGGSVSISGGVLSGSLVDTLWITSGTATLSGTGSLSGNTTVEADGGTATISGGTVSGGAGVTVHGGIVNVSGGSITGILFVWSGTANVSAGLISALPGNTAAGVSGGQLNISGGTIAGDVTGVVATGGTVNITGGAISCGRAGGDEGVIHYGGVLAISGCNLHVDGNQLIGTLQDGTLLNTPSGGVDTPDLLNQSTGSLLYTCPSTPIETDAALDECSATVTPEPPTGLSDGCSTPPWVTGAREDGRLLTDPYPVGLTKILWTISDGGGSQSCVQDVVIRDTQLPHITCPGDMTVPATSASGAQVHYVPPPATDNCGTPTVVCSPPPDSIFPIGASPVLCTATDSSLNTKSCNFNVTVSAADVSVTISAPSSVVSGMSLTYSIVARNIGPSPAAGVVITDPPSVGTSFVSATRSINSGTLTVPGGKSKNVTWSVGSLASGSSVTLTVVVKVSAKAATTLSNTATVSSTGLLDPNSANNSATATTPVTAKR
jgi:uncharacterized repeat protein (TIGR01451 family)